MKNKFLVILAFASLILAFAGQVLADSAPAEPPYPNVKLNVKVGLGSFADKYVIIEEYGGRGGEYYSLVTDQYVRPNGYGGTAYIALDKSYFQSGGGIKGLFSTTGSDENVIMSPKDTKNFNAHSYKFIIPKNDPVLTSEFEGPLKQTIESKYVEFPFNSDFYIRQGPDDSNCHTDANGGTKNCSMGQKTVTYVAQQVLKNNLVLANSDTLNQNTTSEVPPPHVVWWKKVWNFIKSLF